MASKKTYVAVRSMSMPKGDVIQAGAAIPCDDDLGESLVQRGLARIDQKTKAGGKPAAETPTKE